MTIALTGRLKSLSGLTETVSLGRKRCKIYKQIVNLLSVTAVDMDKITARTSGSRICLQPSDDS